MSVGALDAVMSQSTGVSWCCVLQRDVLEMWAGGCPEGGVGGRGAEVF